jgi:hypothetical protein
VGAYIGSVKEIRAVRQWADDERKPSEDVLLRLRAAYQIASCWRKRIPPPWSRHGSRA